MNTTTKDSISSSLKTTLNINNPITKETHILVIKSTNQLDNIDNINLNIKLSTILKSIKNIQITMNNSDKLIKMGSRKVAAKAAS